MIDFSKITRVTIPEGVAIEIKDGNGNSIWDAFHMKYVSLGDSIAAGQSIDGYWATNYGVGSQYGENGNTSTEIVTNSYTDLIKNKLEKSYDPLRVSTKSFAHSGDTVANLIVKLNHDWVKGAIERSNIVTICIGANDILGEVSGDVIERYITQGNPALESLKETIDGNLTTLRGQGDNSLRQLFSRLTDINPTAKYIFTTIYNPYKYLKIGQNFFTAWFNDVGKAAIEGFSWGLEEFLGIATTSLVTSRVNALGSWVEDRITDLNTDIRNAISAYANDNFTVVDTKRLFDTFPDNIVSATYHYNDLVNVDVTEGFAWNSFDWGVLYPAQNWVGATTYYASKLYSAGGNLSRFIELVMADIVPKVIMPRIDPHPRTHGQYVLSRSYLSSSMFGDNAVPLNKFTITYNKGTNGIGDMASEEIWAVDGVAYVKIKDSSFTPSVTGYRFIGWKDQNRNNYSNGQVIKLTSNVTLTAQWEQIKYTVNFYKSLNDYARNFYTVAGRDVTKETGIQEIYGCDISTDGGVTYKTLDTTYYRGNFSSSGDKLISSKQYSYGTKLRVWVTYTLGDSIWGQSQYKETTSHIYLNGSLYKSEYKPIFEFELTSNTNINFEWVLSGTVYLDATANWNCYVEQKK